MRKLLLLALALAFSAQAAAYTFPTTPMPPRDDNVAELQKLSKGVAAIAKDANKAIVFVSVFKATKANPYGQIDPFEFFFGPGSRGGPPPQGEDDQQGRQQRPPQRRGGQGDPGQRREGGLGSGFIVDLAKGYVITNNHVVAGADEIQLKLANGKSYEGKVVGRDANTDVAVVQIKDLDFPKEGLGALALGNSDQVTVGDFVVALGAPFGLEASLSFGVVSAVGRGNLDIAKFGNFIQTDAAINPGNSGGPLLGMNGQVIAMNTAIYSRSGAYNGIGFAVPANLVKQVAEQLITSGHFGRGYLGVFLQPIDEDLRGGLNLPADFRGGALVAKVAPGSPADQGDVEAGDVVYEVNGVPMKDNSEVVNTIGLMRPGTEVKLSILREGAKKLANVKIGKHPEDEGSSEEAGAGGRTPDEPATKGGIFGMGLATLTPALQKKHGLESKKGALVTGIEPGSPAERAGLRAGDLILKADGKKVESEGELKKLAKGKDRVLVWLERGGEFYFQTIRSN